MREDKRTDQTFEMSKTQIASTLSRPEADKKVLQDCTRYTTRLICRRNWHSKCGSTRPDPERSSEMKLHL